MDIEVQRNVDSLTLNLARRDVTISLQEWSTKKIWTWGRKPYTISRHVTTSTLRKKAMLEYSSTGVEYPEVITGWNCRLYDIPYLCGRLNHYGWEEDASIVPMEHRKSSEIQITDVFKCFEFGITTLTPNLQEVHPQTWSTDWPREENWDRRSWTTQSLKPSVTSIVTEKVCWLQHQGRWTGWPSWDKRTHWVGITMFDRQGKLCWPHVPGEDVDTIIYNYLKKRASLFLKRWTDKSDKFGGAYVKEPVPGVYDYVVSFTWTVYILTWWCNTTSHQRHWLMRDILCHYWENPQ